MDWRDNLGIGRYAASSPLRGRPVSTYELCENAERTDVRDLERLS
jgi:hypothetical protein